MANGIEGTSTGQVVVTEVAAQTIEVVSPTAPLTVEIHTQGPQGSAAPVYGLGELVDVNTTGKVANSVLYFDAASGEWKGNDINTITSLTDGGNY